MRTYDALGWNAWGWTPPIGISDGTVPEFSSWPPVPGGSDDPDLAAEVPEYELWEDVPPFLGEPEPDLDEEVPDTVSPASVVGIREVIETHGENVIALCELSDGNEAIYHSPDSGDSWSKVLEAPEIYDITSIGHNWTLASTSYGWFDSLKAGSLWELAAAAGEGVPVGKSVVWVKPNHLFTHTGSAIWLSEDRAINWVQVCDLTAISGYTTNARYNSIDGYQGRIIATCGYALVETEDLGDTWDAINLSAVVRAWSQIGAEQPIWRQVAFWDTLDPLDPAKSRWMISAILTGANIIRTFVGRGAGTFSPVVDMALSERHRLNISQTRRMGADVTDTSLLISGDRRIDGELRHAMTVSNDGTAFTDVLGGSITTLKRPSNPAMDAAYAALTKLVVE